MQNRLCHGTTFLVTVTPWNSSPKISWPIRLNFLGSPLHKKLLEAVCKCLPPKGGSFMLKRHSFHAEIAIPESSLLYSWPSRLFLLSSLIYSSIHLPVIKSSIHLGHNGWRSPLSSCTYFVPTWTHPSPNPYFGRTVTGRWIGWQIPTSSSNAVHDEIRESCRACRISRNIE